MITITTNLNLLFQLTSCEFVSRDSRLLHVLHSFLREWGYDTARCERREQEFYFVATSHAKKPLVKILMVFTEEYPTIRLELRPDGAINLWGVYDEENLD